MADVFSKSKRSEVMSRIRSRGNRDTELALAHLLRAHGIIGWRRHLELRMTNDDLRTVEKGNGKLRMANDDLRTRAGGGVRKIRNSKFGVRNSKIRNSKVRPDFVFLRLRTALFVDGCFWHGCPKHATRPKSNRAFWRRKLAGNKKRDRLVNRMLRRAGWHVLRIWECELAKKNENHLLRRIQKGLYGRHGQ